MAWPQTVPCFCPQKHGPTTLKVKTSLRGNELSNSLSEPHCCEEFVAHLERFERVSAVGVVLFDEIPLNARLSRGGEDVRPVEVALPDLQRSRLPLARAMP